MDAENVGVLIRTSGQITGGGKNPEKEQKFPKIHQVYQAYYQAGRELVTNGKISLRTQKKANQIVIPIPPLVKILRDLNLCRKLLLKKATPL